MRPWGECDIAHTRPAIALLIRGRAEPHACSGPAPIPLNHVIDFEWMREAYIRTRKDGATGIDGATAKDYEANLEANLRDLLERIKSGRYEAPPVRRTYIPRLEQSRWCWRPFT